MDLVQVLEPHPHPIGGVPVHRLLPAAERQMLGPFIFMDHGGPVTLPWRPGAGVPEHPHAGLATFTYLMAGAQQHRDSAGNSATIRSGDIALMTAGRGITHEEMAHRDGPNKESELHFIQMWIALPDDQEECDPAFEFHEAASLPVVELDGASVRVAMGTAWGHTAPTTCHSRTLFADLKLDAGTVLPVDVSEDEIGVFVVDGDATVGHDALKAGHLSILGGRSPTLRTANGCRVVVLGGARFGRPRWIGGSFVGSSRERVERWMLASRTAAWPRIER